MLGIFPFYDREPSAGREIAACATAVLWLETAQTTAGHGLAADIQSLPTVI